MSEVVEVFIRCGQEIGFMIYQGTCKNKFAAHVRTCARIGCSIHFLNRTASKFLFPTKSWGVWWISEDPLYMKHPYGTYVFARTSGQVSSAYGSTMCIHVSRTISYSIPEKHVCTCFSKSVSSHYADQKVCQQHKCVMLEYVRGQVWDLQPKDVPVDLQLSQTWLLMKCF